MSDGLYQVGLNTMVTALIVLIKVRRPTHCGWHYSRTGVLNSHTCRTSELSTQHTRIHSLSSSCGYDWLLRFCIDFPKLMNHDVELQAK